MHMIIHVCNSTHKYMQEKQDCLSLAILLLQCWAIVCGLIAWILPSSRRYSMKASEEGKASTCTSSSPWACSQSWGTTAASLRTRSCGGSQHVSTANMEKHLKWQAQKTSENHILSPSFEGFNSKRRRYFSDETDETRYFFCGPGIQKKNAPINGEERSFSSSAVKSEAPGLRARQNPRPAGSS